MAKRGYLGQKWRQRLIVWGGLVILWELAAVRAGPLFLPRFSDVVGSIIAAFFNGDILTLLGSLRQMVVGFALAAAVGIPVGILMGSSLLVNGVLGPYMRVLFIAPLEALLPFLIILFGTEFNFRVAVVFLFSLFHIVFNTAAGIRATDANLLEMSRAFCASRLQRLYRITLPSILPYVIAGLRLALGGAIKGMIIAELWILVGTGKTLIELGLERQLPEFFALSAWIIVLCVVLARALGAAQHKLMPWTGDIALHLEQNYGSKISRTRKRNEQSPL